MIISKLSCLCIFAALASLSSAQVYRVSSRSNLNLHMAPSGFPAGQVKFTAQPSWTASAGSEQIFARLSPWTDAWHFVQGNGVAYGLFPNGAHLVYLDTPTPTATITFEKPDPANPGKFIPTTVSGFGTDIQPKDGYGTRNYIMIRAFNTTTNSWSPWFVSSASLGFSWTGSTQTYNFIGLGSPARDISMVQVNGDGTVPIFGWWMMDEPNISVTPSPAANPAP